MYKMAGRHTQSVKYFWLLLPGVYYFYDLHFFYYWRAKMKLFGIPICFRLIAPINHQHSLPTSTTFHQGTKYFRSPCNVYVVEERLVFLFIIIKVRQKSRRRKEKLTPQWKVSLIRINSFQNL